MGVFLSLLTCSFCAEKTLLAALPPRHDSEAGAAAPDDNGCSRLGWMFHGERFDIVELA